MTTDHAREAERVMGLAHDSQNQGSWDNASIQIQRAQVHASLQVAYEMRTANLIARAAIYAANNGQTFSEIEERLTVDDWFCTRCGSACERHRPSGTTGSEQ